MPIYLEPKDVSSDLEPFNSVLIVSCLMCPPIAAIANATTKVRLPFKVDLVMQPLKKKRRGYRHAGKADAEE